jgi:cytochrome bd-type quinol oxidase subunit 2
MIQGWDNFYIMAGTSAATLIGLMFVVLTLGTHLAIPASRAGQGLDAFVTPTLVHFGGVLFQSMTALVPWWSRWPSAIIFGLSGLLGLTYAVLVVRLLRRLDFVSLDHRDWFAYAGASGLANLSLLAGSAGLIAEKPFAPFAIAGGVALLLLVGIHDAWDITRWIAKNRDRSDRSAV